MNSASKTENWLTGVQCMANWRRNKQRYPRANHDAWFVLNLIGCCHVESAPDSLSERMILQSKPNQNRRTVHVWSYETCFIPLIVITLFLYIFFLPGGAYSEYISNFCGGFSFTSKVYVVTIFFLHNRQTPEEACNELP